MSQNESFLGESVLPFVLIGLFVIVTLIVCLFTKNLGSTHIQSITSLPKAVTDLDHCRHGPGKFELHMSKGYDSFTPDILIRTLSGEYMVAAAALDTQCEGNWISKRLIEELGLVDSIHCEHDPSQVITVTGEEVESCGSIDLVWKLAPNKNRVYRGKFSVLSSVRHLDVILGQHTINKENILSAHSRQLFATLTAHKRLTKSDKAAIAALEAQQQQDKKSLEARRQAAQQQQQQQQSSNESSNQQQ